ncbi:MAG: radical SAM protein [Candidatus Pacebacteria bacterium]|nr:radical SAM protein [Candidatus Paceibacterota bacterium]
MALNIYLGDLVYNTIKTNYVVPLNIGYVASFLKGKFGQEVNIKLFKYPDILEKALRENPPDILALSHYSWNARLNLLFLEMAKRLNPKILTVMGGPNIRTESVDLKKFLTNHKNLDYHVANEGEEPFARIVGEILGGCARPHPLGCATIIDGEFFYDAEPLEKRSMEISQPSPYLTGWLDPFLADSNTIPLLETNRGCPYRCVYCAWGAMLPRIRTRPLEQVLEEIKYVSDKSAGQLTWMFCDSNFGILPRDVEIAKKVRELVDKKGYPTHVDVWQSKNTPERNIEISEILGKNNRGLVAIQSADPKVLDNIGRGAIKMDSIKQQIDYYHNENLEVGTDILIGLPGESAKSHYNTLAAAFDMGFDYLEPINIRLLQGTRYESDKFRQEYAVKTKYRPIFGAYGIYDNKVVFEVEESVRSTKDMSEEELNNFKIHHWLIFFTWDVGIFKPILLLGKKQGINPEVIIDELSRTQNPILKDLFDRMRKESMKEWFGTEEEMISFYKQPENFNNLVNNFMKLSFFYIALVYQDPEILKALQKEMEAIVTEKLKAKNIFSQNVMNDVIELSGLLTCKNLLEGEKKVTMKYPGEIVSLVTNNPKFANRDIVELEIYRPQEFVSFCRFHLSPSGKENLSLKNIARFLEIGGMNVLKNNIKVL